MSKLLKRKIFWLAAAALVLTAGISIQDTMAYFTTYVTAKGGHPVTLGTQTSIKEEVEDMTKHIVLSNTGECECYVRVKVFGGSMYKIEFSGATDENNNAYWSLNEEDGYWYYKDILAVGEETKELLAKIEIPADSTESFNIVVIQECTPVLYDESGNPYADWNKKIDTRTDIGTVSGEGADR